MILCLRIWEHVAKSVEQLKHKKLLTNVIRLVENGFLNPIQSWLSAQNHLNLGVAALVPIQQKILEQMQTGRTQITMITFKVEDTHLPMELEQA